MPNDQARKQSTKINFLGPETARWGGVLPREGVVAKKFVPSLESLSSLGFEERNLGCPRNFAGMSRTPGGVQKVCAKKVRAHFSAPINVPFSFPGWPRCMANLFTAKIGTWTCLTKGSEIAFWEGSVTESVFVP